MAQPTLSHAESRAGSAPGLSDAVVCWLATWLLKEDNEPPHQMPAQTTSQQGTMSRKWDPAQAQAQGMQRKTPRRTCRPVWSVLANHLYMYVRVRWNSRQPRAR